MFYLLVLFSNPGHLKSAFLLCNETVHKLWTEHYKWDIVLELLIDTTYVLPHVSHFSFVINKHITWIFLRINFIFFSYSVRHQSAAWVCYLIHSFLLKLKLSFVNFFFHFLKAVPRVKAFGDCLRIITLFHDVTIANSVFFPSIENF